MLPSNWHYFICIFSFFNFFLLSRVWWSIHSNNLESVKNFHIFHPLLQGIVMTSPKAKGDIVQKPKIKYHHTMRLQPLVGFLIKFIKSSSTIALMRCVYIKIVLCYSNFIISPWKVSQREGNLDISGRKWASSTVQFFFYFILQIQS